MRKYSRPSTCELFAGHTLNDTYCAHTSGNVVPFVSLGRVHELSCPPSTSLHFIHLSWLVLAAASQHDMFKDNVI